MDIKLKKYDYFVIILSIVGILSSLAFAYPGKNEESKLVVYSNKNRQVYSMEDAEIVINNELGYVKVIVQDNQVRIYDSSCKDKWCKNMGWIDQPGETLICLPSRIFITIEEKRNNRMQYDTRTR
ncbi:MAG: NusG domain II-containing protein [Vulcanimicrobiota bacterium]